MRIYILVARIISFEHAGHAWVLPVAEDEEAAGGGDEALS